jgi:RHS repeat-associated protein
MSLKRRGVQPGDILEVRRIRSDTTVSIAVQAWSAGVLGMERVNEISHGQAMRANHMKEHILKVVATAMLWMLYHVAYAGAVTYVYTDPQGTPLAEADASGNIIATFDYAPYGSRAMGTAPDGPGYTGHVNDPELGLVYMQARYYDPVVGRFLSTDPVSPAASNPFNFNRFTYANNNPIANIDPNGRDCTSTNGMTTCIIPVTGSLIPQRISFPTPGGVSGTQKSSAASEHLYDIRTPNGSKSEQAVQRSIVNHPTPGSSDKPATPTGTLNYAAPSGLRGTLAVISSYMNLGRDDPRSPVKSYSATDNNGNTWAINVTEPTHGFHFGYVLRGSVNGQTISIGEGWAWKQKTPILGNYADHVWNVQNQVNIDEAH